MSRVRITKEQRTAAIESLREQLESRLKQKGDKSFASIHEILGIVTEEHLELIDAVKDNHHDLVKHELLDIAVACVFGVACIDANVLDW